jgi:glycerol-3-phosphate cytidylyltransferase
MKIGIIFSTFDLLHSCHSKMLEEAKNQCDYLIVGLQTDPSIDCPEKNKPIQSLLERYIQLKACNYVDGIVFYTTEKDLLDILKSIPVSIRIVDDAYSDEDFPGRTFCEASKIELYFNKRADQFSSSTPRIQISSGNL